MEEQTKRKSNLVSIPEVVLSFHRETKIEGSKKISNSRDAANTFRTMFADGEIELHEVMFVLYLDKGNKPLGYYKHTIGGHDSTIVDVKMIVATALKCLTSSIMLCHNHPSGNIRPSDSDHNITRGVKEGAKFFNIELLDHIILSKDHYHSMADEGLFGIPGYLQNGSSNPSLLEPKLNDRLNDLEKAAIRIKEIMKRS